MCSQDDAHFATRVKGGANTTLRNTSSPARVAAISPARPK